MTSAGLDHAASGFQAKSSVPEISPRRSLDQKMKWRTKKNVSMKAPLDQIHGEMVDYSERTTKKSVQ